MKLTIIVLAASAWIRFTTPGPGTYYLYSTEDYRTARIEASGHFTNAVNVTAQVPVGDGYKNFFVRFDEDRR